MPVVDADTITVFLARLAVDSTEQGKYLRDIDAYLDNKDVKRLSKGKKDVLKTRDKKQINAAIMAEQKGKIHARFTGSVTYATQATVRRTRPGGK